MSAPLGLALVGPGAIAVEHLRAFATIGGTHNSWVIGRSPDALPGFAIEWGFTHHGTDLDAALNDDAVDIVLICSPSTLHAAHAERALLAGKHVIVEIPMAMSRAEAEALVATADRVGRTIQVCHTMRSFAAISYMRGLVASGADSVSQVFGYFGVPRRDNQGFRGQRTWVDDLLWHHACHLVDASLWVLDTDTVHDPRLLRGREHPTLGMTMDVTLSFSTDSQQLVTHALTYNTASLGWQMRFICDSGQYLFDNGSLRDSEGRIVVQGASIRDLRIQNRSMLDALASGVAGHFDARSALPSMACLQDLEANEAAHGQEALGWES